MGKEFNKPWIRGSIYHVYGVQNTMGRGFHRSWLRSFGIPYEEWEVKIPWVGDQHTMNRVFNIPYP
jgi:hypothetical protein